MNLNLKIKSTNTQKLNVFFTASYSGEATHQKYYDMVREALEKQDVNLVSPEKGNINLGNTRASHYEGMKRGILQADAVVLEISVESFQVGHEATLAIQDRKHLLCLSLNEDFSEKIKNRYFHGAKYSEYTVEEIVEEFVRRAKKERLSQRFNLFLSARQLEILERKATKMGVNMSEYLRTLLEE